MSATLEEHRAGTTDSSLARTLVGLWWRELGGWVPTSAAVTLLRDAGVAAPSARTSLSRLRTRGLLAAERRDGVAGYRLVDEAHPMLARGDRRIYGYRPMAPGDPYMLVVFSVPEAQRSLRHRLRTHLTWLGCGSVAPGTWIGPGHLVEETLQVLGEVELAEYVTVFRADPPVVAGTLADAVARWWELDVIAGHHAAFLAVAHPLDERWHATADGPADGPTGSDAQAYADHLRVVDAWRSIPYLDPGLPADLLPPDWPGAEGVRVFASLSARLRDRAARHVHEVALGRP
ncbi:PaaX family transcriptional regulator [Thalassiella azotivora]